MDTITRHSCGFATFEECDPTTCTRDCFTSRVIEINARHAPQPAKFGPVALSIIFAISVAALAGAVAIGPTRVEAQFQSDMRR